MPVNVIVGLVALLIALVTYSIGVWGAFRAKEVTSRHLVFLWIGVAFDVVATASMSYSLGWKLEASWHTYLALLAFFGMTCVAAIGTYATAKKDDKMLSLLPRWAVAPWALWVIVFVWGMIERSPRK